MLHQAILNEILEERVESSRGRRNVRGVKQKMSNYPLRRRNQPLLPARIDFETCIVIKHPQIPEATAPDTANADSGA